MRIVVLGSPRSWYLEDLRRAAAGQHEVVPSSFQQLASEIGPSGVLVRSGEVRLDDCDAVLVRGMPPGSLEQIVFRMDALAELAASGVKVVNPPRAIEVAVDKYLATTRLQQAGLLVPQTVICQSAEQAMIHFEQLGGDVVVKPLFGSEGRGIVRVSDEGLALRTFKTLERLDAAIYLQKFISHEGFDIRLLVSGDEVLGMRRRHATDWRTNINRGAIGEPLEDVSDFTEIARQAAAAVGATLAGVDLLPGRDGQLYAIEVNAVPGWRALAEVTGVDVSTRVLRHLSSD